MRHRGDPMGRTTDVQTGRTRDAVSARSRFVGCLLGGAVGDALGAPIEFQSIDQIRADFAFLVEDLFGHHRLGNPVEFRPGDGIVFVGVQVLQERVGDA